MFRSFSAGPGRRGAGRGRGGFTLIELLIVITIIMIMMSMIAVVAIRARHIGHIEAAKADVQRIAIALERYFSELRTLPPDTGFDMPMDADHRETDPDVIARHGGDRYDPGSLWRYLTRRLTDNRSGRSYGPYLEWDQKRLKRYKDAVHDDPVDDEDQSFYLVDPWGNPYGYVGDSRRVVRNPGSFDIFSVGPDGVTACNDNKDNDGDGVRDRPVNKAYDGALEPNDTNGIADDAEELGEAAYNGDCEDDINNWTAMD